MAAVSLVLGTSACFVCDALGFTIAPLLPTVPGPETSELTERMRGTLAVSNGYECRDVTEYPGQLERPRICLPEDCYLVDATASNGQLVYLFDYCDWGDQYKDSRWAIRVAPIEASKKTRDIVAGLGEVDGAGIAVAESGSWVAVTWYYSPPEFGYGDASVSLLSPPSVSLLSMDEQRFVWNRPTGRPSSVGIIEDLRLVLFTANEDGRDSLRTCSFDGLEEHEIARGELIAFDRRERVALVRDGSTFATVSVPAGERLIEPALLPGRTGSILMLLDGRYAVYEALPTEGAPQKRYRLGLAAPSPYSTIKLCDLETGAFVTLVSDVLDPGSFAFPAP